MADPKSKISKPVKVEAETTQGVDTPGVSPVVTTSAPSVTQNADFVAAIDGSVKESADPLAAVPIIAGTAQAADAPQPASADVVPAVEPAEPEALLGEPSAPEAGLEGWSYYGTRCPAAVDVLKERVRQVEGEGYGVESDDGYTDYQLPRAAICYAIKAAGLPSHRATLYWPFPAPAFKPTERRANLVKAAALLLAEIERLDRAESPAD
nr:hypothetical protein [uncultured Pseudomonas sp.]